MLESIVNALKQNGHLAYSQGSFTDANQLILQQREDGKWVATVRKIDPPKEEE